MMPGTVKIKEIKMKFKIINRGGYEGLSDVELAYSFDVVGWYFYGESDLEKV